MTAAQFKARYLAWIRECRQIGLVPGLYHWIRAGSGAAQARLFHGLVVEAGGPRGLLVALDCEDDATYADVVAWRDEWRRLTGGHPFLLYTGGWWWRPRGWDGAAITPYLWDSHYLTADTDTIADDPSVFAARIPADWWTPGYGRWSGATILQFTSRGDAGSLGNNVDLDATKLSQNQLLALTGDDDMTPEELFNYQPVAKDNYAPERTFRMVIEDMYDVIQRRLMPEFKALRAELAEVRAKLADPVDEAALAAQLVERLQPLAPGATVEQVREILASVRLTPGA